MLSLAPGAHADHALVELASPGSAGSANPNLNRPYSTSSVSPDGSRVFFTTPDSLAPTDSDGGYWDLYERSGAVTTLVSTGPVAGGPVHVSATEFYFAREGRRVFFNTSERLVPEDTDTTGDMYEWLNGVVRLIDIGVGGTTNYNWFQFSADGSRLFFESTAQLTPEDTDNSEDVYEYANGQTRLVTAGTSAEHLARFPLSTQGAVSDDGSRVIFETVAAFVPEDTDSLLDAYVWNEGQISLVSTGPGDTHTKAVTAPARMSRDGSRIFFDTAEPLLPEDTDTATDVYERSNGSLTLRSPGGPATAFASLDWVSDDGAHVMFSSPGSFTTGDTDAFIDLYENVNGTTRLVSTGPGTVCPVAPFRCEVNDVQAMSADGKHAVFVTAERLVPEDTNSCEDVYERVDGAVTRLVSTGPTASGSCKRLYEPIRISDDGERIIFQQDGRFATEDTDDGKCSHPGEQGPVPAPCEDVYERHAGVTTLLSTGPIGGSGGFDAHFAGASDDGSVVAFHTLEPLLLSDTNGQLDVYVRRVATGYPRPISATPINVSLVPAYRECTAPNREHGPPLANPSCAPPQQASPNLTVRAAGGENLFKGSVRLALRLGPAGGVDDTDVRLRASLSHVMHASDSSEYTGELRATAIASVTDKDGGVPSTIQDFPLSFDVPCVPTSDPNLKSTCDIATDLDAVIPGATPEGTRAVWALDQVKVYDGGPDEDGDTEQDNSLFAVQGIFVP